MILKQLKDSVLSLVLRNGPLGFRDFINFGHFWVCLFQWAIPNPLVHYHISHSKAIFCGVFPIFRSTQLPRSPDLLSHGPVDQVCPCSFADSLGGPLRSLRSDNTPETAAQAAKEGSKSGHQRTYKKLDSCSYIVGTVSKPCTPGEHQNSW